MATQHRLGRGFHWEDLQVGDTMTTNGRTITEADLVAFCNLTWFTEELFTNLHDREGTAIAGRVVPGALVFTFAEGLLMPAIQHTGLAFLDSGLSIKGPTCVGDTIHVEVEVTEMRPTSKPGRGLIRTRNRVMNQHGAVVQEYTPLRLLAMRG
ncbi:MAG: MaoC family dehydratase N-terminal domain-containing protein [Burkholderiales bacterium]|nr:MaoC family dehydratase N-terminal domain-containing protein [Burkholderiales bacterium]